VIKLYLRLLVLQRLDQMPVGRMWDLLRVHHEAEEREHLLVTEVPGFHLNGHLLGFVINSKDSWKTTFYGTMITVPKYYLKTYSSHS